jgi:uncharacterized protein (DUF111 family)
MTVTAVGYGAGTLDLESQPNVVRIMIGDAAEKSASASCAFDQEIAVIEVNMDDMNPQIYGHFQERALTAGALDVYTTPVQMKKNRPGTLLTVLCNPQDRHKLLDLIFAETTTIGARTYNAQRAVLPRESVAVSTPYGEVRMKVASFNGHIRQATPEYEDCRALALQKNIPLQQVISAAQQAFVGARHAVPVPGGVRE